MLPKGPYKPEDHEKKIYQLWEEKGYFQPSDQNNKQTYSIVLPPPNVTGVLHVGHALMLAIEDLLIRFQRMQGKRTLWVPGTDHAAIATASKVEKQIYKTEGKSRHDLGREEFLKRVEQYASQSHDTIVNQIKTMGASCDWSREAFTLDEKRTQAVRTAFKNMYEDGLIYRKDRVINWDPKGQTTISDDEVVYKQREATLYTFKYDKDFPFAISTTRPETKLGDTAVAVHPEDNRYKKYIGQEIQANFCGTNLKLKIIADENVDPNFGTGALGVTPAHSHIDWEMAQKHNLNLIQVINEYARIITDNPKLKDKKVTEAREIIVDMLKKEDLIEKEEPTEQNVATAERTGALVEPLPKEQWFIDVNKKFTLKKSKIKGLKTGESVSLKQTMQHVVKNNQIEIVPDRFKKIYFHWIDNLRDWCISRQIWYGHQIPAWYCLKCENANVSYKRKLTGEMQEEISLSRKNVTPIVSIKKPNKCPKCQSDDKLFQDPDTLDTWFSSGLWTFSTLGWPEKTQDLEDFHPTSVMETGYDILFFWVARMILMSTYHLEEIPFKRVYLHGLIRDKDRQKMSKSKDNAIDPLGIIEDYGTDALRMAMVFNTGQGNDVVLSQDKVVAQKKFANKIWNASKFVLMNLDQDEQYSLQDLNFSDNSKADKNIFKQLQKTTKNITQNIDSFMFHEAAQSIYHFFWDDFCDIYLEKSKEALNNSSPKEKNTTQQNLLYVLIHSLKLLHPFMPFVTETIWQELPLKDKQMLIIESWPEFNQS